MGLRVFIKAHENKVDPIYFLNKHFWSISGHFMYDQSKKKKKVYPLIIDKNAITWSESVLSFF